MIYLADSKLTFHGVNAIGRAFAFVQEMPEGAAVLCGDGTTIRMLRSVVIERVRFATTAELRLAARGEAVPERRILRLPVAAMLLLGLLLCPLSGVCGGQSAVSFRGAAAVFPGGFTAAAFPQGAVSAFGASGFPLATDTLSTEQEHWLGNGLAVVIILGAASAALVVISQRNKTQKVSMDPSIVTTAKAPRWATWEEVEHLRSEVAAMRDDIVERDDQKHSFLEKKFGDVSHERSVSTARLHERIEAVAAGLRTDLDTKIEGVRREVHDMPGKLVTLLKETGAIGGKRG